MSKAKIIIKYNGAYWRVGSSWRCASKRDCDLYEKGVCDRCSDKYPCFYIAKAFSAATCSCPNNGYKKIKEV